MKYKLKGVLSLGALLFVLEGAIVSRAVTGLQISDFVDHPLNYRVVAHSEVGLLFSYPSTGMSWREIGAYVGPPLTDNFSKMSPNALRIPQGRFQHFEPADDTGYSFFPYSRLKEFEQHEVLEGRKPIFITATYHGRRKPVYFAWSLGLQGGDTPSTDPSMWMQAVDVTSDRYIDFWVNQYVKPILWQGKKPSPAWWIGADNCAFRWDLYGIIDDSGHFVTGVPWNAPFPQNSTQYVASIAQFFRKLKQVAPEAKVVCNVGSLKDPSQFESIYADVPGIMTENICNFDAREFARRGQQELIGWISWFGAMGRVALLRAVAPPNDREKLRTAYAMYLLVKGPNFFFNPEYETAPSGLPTGLPLTEFLRVESSLGVPTGNMRVEARRGKGSPYNLYSRTFERGIVYVNWTGAPWTVTLPPQDSYVDAQGTRTTTITIPDLSGTYLLREAPEFPGRNHIH